VLLDVHHSWYDAEFIALRPCTTFAFLSSLSDRFNVAILTCSYFSLDLAEYFCICWGYKCKYSVLGLGLVHALIAVSMDACSTHL